MKSLYLKLFILCVLLSLSGCNPQSQGAFENLDLKEEDITMGPVVISTVTPDGNLIDLSKNVITFAVSLEDGSGIQVNYQFILDDIIVQDGPSPFFKLTTFPLTPQKHTLKVVASNPISSDSYTFNLYKNTPPTLNYVSNSNTTISCTDGTFQMQVVATDADGDAVTFKFLVNGVEYVDGSTGSVTNILATHNYEPPSCAVQGIQQVTIRGIDTRGGVSDYSISVNVINPNVATINSYSPITNPTTIKSTESINFAVGATGAPPLKFHWTIDPGGDVSVCEDSSNCSISGSDYPPGPYVLRVDLTDSVPTTDSQSFNIIINAPPVISFNSPTVNDVVKMNCSLSKNYAINFTDANYSDSGQNLTVTWRVDNAPSGSLGITTNTLTPPFSSTATFSPNCDTNLLGEHTISVTVSDGFETISRTWTVQTNFFPDVCNEILNDTSSASNGKVCTIAGLTGQYTNFNPTLEPNKAKFLPQFVELYDPNISNAFFFTSNHAVWFYNGTNSDITVLGRTVVAGQVSALIGNGAFGVGTIGQSYNNFLLYTPYDLYYDKANDKLYIADYSSSRILVVGNNGTPAVFAGGGTSEVDGALNTAHRCNGPINIIRDGDDLIVNCRTSGTNQGMIKKFSLTTNTGTTIMRYLYDSTVDVFEGTLGIAGTGGAAATWGMAKHPTEKLLFAADNAHRCQLYAINYGGSDITLPGLNNLVVPANEMRRLGNTSVICTASSYPIKYDNTALRLYTYGIETKTDPDTGDFLGIYLGQYHYGYVTFLNLSSSTVNIAGRTTDPGFFSVAIGAGTGFNRASPVFSNTYFWYPVGLTMTSHGIYIADSYNGRVTLFNEKTTDINTAPQDLLGFNQQFGYDGIVNKTTTEHHLNSPAVITYDPNLNRMLFYDSGNLRIRSLNLDTGELDVVVGNGNSGQLTADPVDSLSNFFRMRNIRDMAMVPNQSVLAYLDSYTSYNVSNVITPPNPSNAENCAVRLWNFGNSFFDYGDFSIDVNNVKNIIGDRAYGCANWSTDYEGRSPTDIALNNSYGLVYTPSGNVFVASNYQACIIKLDSETNTVSQIMGLCGTGGNVNGAFASTRFSSLGELELDSDPTAKAAGNFFIIDRWMTTSSNIKYANFLSSNTSVLNSSPIAKDNVGLIKTTEGYTTSIATFGNQVCYNQGYAQSSSAGAQNILCFDRISGNETLRIGRPSTSTVKGGVQFNDEDEGIHASNINIWNPYYLAFDSDGNLYFTERNHSIKMVKRWW